VVGEEEHDASVAVTERLQAQPRDLAGGEECIELMRNFIRDNPALWNEDIGV
jgi:hypothetical protein